ncbi:FAD-dependent oxidoreductase [Candidatus Dojkabacteria bacterium]|nr:FAD-dependent oxidoreductase [Candidatus Dojkabacteria bacterium]
MSRQRSKNFDVIVVGAGPAGIFATYELLKHNPNLAILLIERGERAEKRKKTEAMVGFGGGGTYSDGKLHYTPVLSHRKALSLISIDRYVKLVNYVDKIFSEYGVNGEYYPKDSDRVQELVEQAQKNDIKLYVRKARHVGTDKLEKLIKKIQDYFEDSGVVLMSKTLVKDLIIKRGVCKGVVTDKGREIYAGKTLVAPGRVGAKWLQDICKKYSIEYLYDKIEVGVRVEFPESVMREYSELMYESIFEMRTKHFDDVIRTFCPCPYGTVTIEDYKGYVCVNGHTNSSHDSTNSNFAFVTEIELTEPVENTTAYARSIAELATTLGGGKPILQRLADLKAGRRSTWKRIEKSYISPTLKEVTPGDISMAMPYRITTDILEGLEKLDRVMPGINAGSTLLYAPEVKYRGSKVMTDKGLQTEIRGLFVAGDGAGVSGNIIGAAVTGVMGARGIIKSLNK